MLIEFSRHCPWLHTMASISHHKCHAWWWVTQLRYLIHINYWIITMEVIMITRLHVMYQRSRAMLIFLVITFLAITVACGVIVAKQSSPISWRKFWLRLKRFSAGSLDVLDEIIVLGTYHCVIEGTDPSVAKSWILITVWEVLALCLAVWITLKHFRELRRSRIGSTIRDWFTVLIKSHLLYFAAWARNLNVIICTADLVHAVALLLFLASTSDCCPHRSRYVDLWPSLYLTTAYRCKGVVLRWTWNI